MLAEPLCANCGHVLPALAQFCSACGSRLDAGTDLQGQVSESVPAEAATTAVSGPAVPSEMCRHHPTVTAVRKCNACGAPICTMCDFPVSRPSDEMSILQLAGEMHYCPACARRRPEVLSPALAASLPVVPLPGGVKCMHHPEVAAVRRCSVCSTPVCVTCDFEMPGYFHICPECASKPQREMSSGRKRNLVISYVLAALATLGFAVILSGLLGGLITSKADTEALGVAMMLVILVPALVGGALSIGCFDRKLTNSPAIWVSAIWNALIVFCFVLLEIVGLVNR
jgi:hypothetical protein